MRRGESFCADLQIFYILLNTFYRESGYGFITPQGEDENRFHGSEVKVGTVIGSFPGGSKT